MTTWDASFEASPADGDAANQGANKIRELKTAISERLELEMNFKTGTQPLIKAGQAAVIYSGSTGSIAGLSSVSNGALAYDTSLDELKRYDSSWGNLALNHATLSNLTTGDPHTQYLKLDKASQELTANLDVAANVTIDGIDISTLSNTANQAADIANNANDIANNANDISNNANDISDHTGDTASNEHTGGIGNAFGAWSGNMAANSNHTADTDGIVCAYGFCEVMYGYTPGDGGSGKVSQGFSGKANLFNSITFPVRKGDTWRVLPAGGTATSIRFLPLGS